MEIFCCFRQPCCGTHGGAVDDEDEAFEGWGEGREG